MFDKHDSHAIGKKLGWIALAAAALTWIASGEWLPGAAVGVLWVIWRILYEADAPPILPLALTYQWGQVTCGMFYEILTGRRVQTYSLIDYQPVVLLGLATVLVLALGLWAGRRWLAPAPRDIAAPERLGVEWGGLIGAYVIGTVIQGTVQRFAFSYPSLTQPLLALTSIRLVLLFIILRRLARPEFRWGLITAVTLFEAILNSTGYFADFREPLVLALVAILETKEWRRPQHLVALGAIAVLLFTASVVWISVRGTYRREIDTRESFGTTARLERLSELVGDWWQNGADTRADNVDALVDRMWAVYYPALAMRRVPNVLPHTDGRLMNAVIMHLVQPRVFFPDKPELPSDSELVRQYSGVWVAGREERTTIAFGYMAESYVDYGVPWLFVPIAAFGLLLGSAYGWLRTGVRNIELRVPTLAVIFWISLFAFEKAWAKLAGFSLTLLIYVGLAAVLVDRFILNERSASGAAAPIDMARVG